MRKKTPPPDSVKERRQRRTQAAMLGEPSKDQRRLIKDIATSADLPIQRVFRDVISAGLSVFASPESSPYRTIIEFRKELETREAAFYGMEKPKISDGEQLGSGSADQHVGNGSVAEGSDEEDPGTSRAVSQLGGYAGVEERSGDAIERPGLSSSDEERDSVPYGLREASPSDDDEVSYP